jgi:hypothetical protein
MVTIDSAHIHGLIETFLARDDPSIEWAKPAVMKHGFFPLYVGWIVTLGLRPDGRFVHWRHEDGIDAVTPCDTPFLQRLALAYSARQNPELAALIPPPPPEAIPCAHCGGHGRLDGAVSRMICLCGGVGWRIPGEDLGEPTG